MENNLEIDSCGDCFSSRCSRRARLLVDVQLSNSDRLLQLVWLKEPRTERVPFSPNRSLVTDCRWNRFLFCSRWSSGKSDELSVLQFCSSRRKQHAIIVVVSMEPSYVGRKLLLPLTKGWLLKARLGSAVISEGMWEVVPSTFFLYECRSATLLCFPPNPRKPLQFRERMVNATSQDRESCVVQLHNFPNL